MNYPENSFQQMKEEISQLKSQLSTARKDAFRDVADAIGGLIAPEDRRVALRRLQSLIEKER